MRTINEPVNTFVGDKLGSREVKLIELLIYLNGHDLAFLFDNNQQGNAVNQAPSVWEQVNIKNAAGVSQDCVQLSLGRSSDCISVPSLLASYVSAVGKYCVNNVTGASCAQGAAQSSPCNANDYDVNDNWSTARLNLPYAVLI